MGTVCSQDMTKKLKKSNFLKPFMGSRANMNDYANMSENKEGTNIYL